MSPETLQECCNDAQALVYENIKTHDRCTFYKDAFFDHAEASCSDGGAKWDSEIENVVLEGHEGLYQKMKRTVAGKSAQVATTKATTKRTKKRGHHFIYVLTREVREGGVRVYIMPLFRT